MLFLDRYLNAYCLLFLHITLTLTAFVLYKLSQALPQLTVKSERILDKFTSLNMPTERSFFPSIKGLPEGIRDKLFIKKYGDVNDLRYSTLESEIHQRIDKLIIYQ